MAWLETDFRPGDPLHRIKARWLSEVANALNSLDVELHDDIAIPYVERPAYPGRWIIHLPAPGKGGGGAATPFNHRWRVTVSENETSRTLRIEPGTLWRNDGAGVVDLGVVPDGETVAVADDGSWTAQTSGSGSLYVADASPAPLLVWGDLAEETRPILLRVADIVVASSGTTLVQRAVGDQLHSVGGGGSEPLRFLQVALREYPAGSSGTQKWWCCYLGKPLSFRWLSPATEAEGATGAPWDWVERSGVIEPWGGDGWTRLITQEELNESSAGGVFALVVYLRATAEAVTASMGVDGGFPAGDYMPRWDPDQSLLVLPCAVISGAEGARTITNIRVGEVALEPVAANACSLLRKRDGEWSEVVSDSSAEENDEFAIAQWYALRAHCHNAENEELTFDLSLRESMYAYAGTPCVSHAADHLGGIV